MKAGDTKKTGRSLDDQYGRMLVELSGIETLESLAEFVIERVLGTRNCAYERVCRMTFVKSVFVSIELCTTLGGYDKSRNRTQTPKTGGSVLHKQNVYATITLNAGRMMINSFLLIRVRITKGRRYGLKRTNAVFL